MSADAVFLLVILALVATVIVGRFVGARARSTVLVPLTGEIDPPAQWLPLVAEQARPRLSMLGWESYTGTVVGDQDDVSGRVAIIRSGDGTYEVQAFVPEFSERRIFTDEEPLHVAVSLDAFEYRADFAQKLLLGLYPKPPAFRAKKKLLKTVKRNVGAATTV